jgi:hypothetical protein
MRLLVDSTSAWSKQDLDALQTVYSTVSWVMSTVLCSCNQAKI